MLAAVGFYYLIFKRDICDFRCVNQLGSYSLPTKTRYGYTVKKCIFFVNVVLRSRATAVSLNCAMHN